MVEEYVDFFEFCYNLSTFNPSSIETGVEMIKTSDVYAATLLILLPYEVTRQYCSLGKSLLQSVVSGVDWAAPIFLCFLFFSVSRRLN